MTKDTEFERAVVMTQDLDGSELKRQLLDNLHHIVDDVDPLDEVKNTYETLLVALCFPEQFISEATCRDFLEQPLWEVPIAQILFEHRDRHLNVVYGEVVLRHDLLKICWGGSPDLDLQLVPSAKLVLDVLDRAKALENSTLDHNAHLGG